MDGIGLTYFIGAWIAILIIFIAFKMNSDTCKRLINTPLRPFLGPKLYAEFFLTIGVMFYFLDFSANVKDFGGSCVMGIINIPETVAIFVSLAYILIAAFALRKVKVEDISTMHSHKKIEMINNEISDITARVISKKNQKEFKKITKR